jgi:hypothetical protein
MKTIDQLKKWSDKCVLTSAAGSLGAGWFATFLDPTGVTEAVYGALLIGAALQGIIHIRKCHKDVSTTKEKAESDPRYLIAAQLKGIKNILSIILVALIFGIIGQLISTLKISTKIYAVGSGVPLLLASSVTFFLALRIFDSASE